MTGAWAGADSGLLSGAWRDSSFGGVFVPRALRFGVFTASVATRSFSGVRRTQVQSYPASLYKAKTAQFLSGNLFWHSLYRHGTLSLYAALDTRSGEVLGKTASRHTSGEFVAFLEELVATQPKGREIHVIVDNLSAHKTKRVQEFLEEHRKFQIHYTPTYSSWLNQVEIWFSKIQRDVIARGIFKSKADLSRKIMKYIRHHNKTAQPFKWTYRNTKNRL
ncbi:IS630 family transposase [bacterium]|nr:IS630 family transposase [bacterium]